MFIKNHSVVSKLVINTTNSFWIWNYYFNICVKNVGSDIIVNRKAFPNAVEGDIVEIYLKDTEQKKLLLKISAFKENYLSRGN